eukprot:TRINITY_DN38335_c0_g1_i1.p1 TRINITY_DN38335_c0_g1~~TRINITY_DN38335_c0_g1_i1.p1  ORF type:complete len:292 (+),score=49.04 TRINITY_DN38335_c0_g1_i1:147-1022(+)
MAVPNREAKCVDDYLDDLKSGTSESKAMSCVALFSVGHCAEVREAFAADLEAVRALADFIGDISKTAYDVRWEALALIGELCRRERQVSKEENDPVARLNDVALILAQSFADHPTLKRSLEDCKQERSGAQTSFEIAADLLSALPFPGVTGWKTKAKDLLFLDPRLSKQWPRVTRAARQRCVKCDAAVAQPMRCSQCKAVFYCGAPCQKAHWKMGHKARCATFVAMDAKDPVSNESKLFLPTRAQLYAARPKVLASVGFDEYYFEYVLPAEPLPADLCPTRDSPTAGPPAS